MAIPVSIGTAGAALKGVTEKLGILDKLKRRFVNAPAQARAALAVALGNVHDFYEAVDEAIGEFLAIDLGDNVRIVRERLQPFRSAAVEARIAQARFHCTEIRRIYFDHLRGWFSTETGVLSDEDRSRLEQLFDEDLGDTDDAVIEQIDDLANWMREVATQIEALLDQSRRDDAERLLDDTQREARPTRDEVSRLVLKLRSIEMEIRDFKAL